MNAAAAVDTDSHHDIDNSLILSASVYKYSEWVCQSKIRDVIMKPHHKDLVETAGI